MKDIKIGKLLFNRKSILLSAVFLFFNGIVIGTYAVIGIKDNFILFYIAIFIPYLLLLNKIRKNVKEIK